MSRNFSGPPTQEYLRNASAVVSGTPLTIACWFNTIVVDTTQTIMSICNSSANANAFTLNMDGIVERVQAEVWNTTGRTATSTLALSLNTWYHAAAVYVNDNSRIAYTNGGNSGSDSGNKVPSGLDETFIGIQRLAILTGDFGGDCQCPVQIFHRSIQHCHV